MKDRDGIQFTLFVNYCSLALNTTINMSVHQVFEEKGSLNFIYLFQSPETITIVPFSLKSKVPKAFFQNLTTHLSTFQH